MTTWQTDICDTQDLALKALGALFNRYAAPVKVKNTDLEVVYCPVEDESDELPEETAPERSPYWQELTRLTNSLARMGYFTTSGEFEYEDKTWRVTCRRNKKTYTPPCSSGVAMVTPPKRAEGTIQDPDAFPAPTLGESVAVVRNYSAGRETVVRGGAVQITDLPAMTVITVWKE